MAQIDILYHIHSCKSLEDLPPGRLIGYLRGNSSVFVSNFIHYFASEDLSVRASFNVSRLLVMTYSPSGI